MPCEGRSLGAANTPGTRMVPGVSCFWDRAGSGSVTTGKSRVDPGLFTSLDTISDTGAVPHARASSRGQGQAASDGVGARSRCASSSFRVPAPHPDRALGQASHQRQRQEEGGERAHDGPDGVEAREIEPPAFVEHGNVEGEGREGREPAQNASRQEQQPSLRRVALQGEVPSNEPDWNEPTTLTAKVPEGQPVPSKRAAPTLTA